MDDVVGEAIDRLINVEMRFASGLPRGIIHKLYDAARSDQKRPLTTLAVEALLKNVGTGDNVLIVTGAGAPPWLPVGETDGPLGAAAVARALDIGIGAKPIIVSEKRNLPPIAACLEACGLAVHGPELFSQRSACALIDELALGDEEGPESARALLTKYTPKAIIFIEKGGVNSKGVFHTITGNGRGRDVMASADALAEAAAAEGILTIGVGDGGNEIGFGRIAEAVAEVQPKGRVCACPCGAGIATTVPTDVLVVAAISNWGGYGLAAGLAIATENKDVLHDAAIEREMLRRCVEAGAVDGIKARLMMGVDGTSAACQEAIITMLGNLVENALQPLTRPF